MRFIHGFQLFLLALSLPVGSIMAQTAGSATLPATTPADSLPAQWLYSEHFDQSLPTEDGWWKSFNDPLLDTLIEMGVQNNYNVLMAARRMEMARLTLAQTRSEYFPVLDLDAGWTKSRSSGAMTSPVTDASTLSYFSLGVNMSWQIDVFGKISAAAKARKASWQASRAEYAATMVTLCGNIATAYAGLRVYQAERAVAVAHLDQQDKVVKITEARFEAGLASMLEVAQAKTVFYSTKASIPQLDQSINASINSLAVLLAISMESAHALLDAPKPLPDYRQMVRTGVPMELLRRRPDIVEAEKEMAMYAAELGVAKKDFLPTLTLDGSIGTSAHRAGDLFSNRSLTYSIAPTLSWTIFEGMRRKYATESAREALRSSVDSYNLTVIQAVTEADNAMCDYVQTLKRIADLQNTVEQSGKSLELSLDLYKKGLAAFTNVVDAQLDYLTYTNNVIVAQGQAITDLVNLYEALGGGWDASALD
ncbi:MAG: efflux transporter outer membrane subunit [Candidatus Amulumruptor caecigallinarius]|nr:efflux transporter outer membrane subunit [Candidatus Amulumruptor caecigallinarius]MCM1397184.1 efflux transporter outer membrane subunit [Candidatus Amulumruptor caecigallinarius]MCM1453127.1 efflux transporter outer membrane subunit [bacterium]